MGYITIDVGTTNTRVKYVKNDQVISKYISQVGVRDTAIRGTLQYLEATLKEGIDYCLKEVDKELVLLRELLLLG